MAGSRVFDEIADFIASGPSTRAVAEFQSSDAAQEHLRDLMNREKNGTLSPDEQAELNSCLVLEHVLRLAKARARQRLAESD